MRRPVRSPVREATQGIKPPLRWSYSDRRSGSVLTVASQDHNENILNCNR